MIRKPISIFLIFILVIFNFIPGCTKDDEYEYLKMYVGSWQFRIYRYSWSTSNYYGKHYDTIYTYGSVSKLPDNRGLSINGLSVWVENEKIIREGSTIGEITKDEMSFETITGTIPSGYGYFAYGVKEISPQDDAESPYVFTSPASGITLSGVVLRGKINAVSGSYDIGFEYGKTENYGNFVSSVPKTARCNIEIAAKAYITGLEPSTVYHFRIKAESPDKTLLGNDMTFITSDFSDPVKDADGNVYKTVRIGSQVWMAENLKTVKYRNGDPLMLIPANGSYSTSEGAYCYQNNDQSGAGVVYGPLYNYYAVTDNRGLCPDGWHVPLANEWNYLLTYLHPNSGDRLKEEGMSHWGSPITESDNSTGFGALPGGYFERSISYLSGKSGYWWTNPAGRTDNLVQAFLLRNSYNFGEIRSTYKTYDYYYSVRCIKD